MNEHLEESLTDFFAGHHQDGVVAAYVFGSHAQGRAHRESDVDVAVLLDWERFPTSSERFDCRVSLGAELISALNCNEIDLVVLNDLPPLFARRILTEGRRVFCADPDAERSFLVDVLSRAADLEPWLRRMRRLKLKALAG